MVLKKRLLSLTVAFAAAFLTFTAVPAYAGTATTVFETAFSDYTGNLWSYPGGDFGAFEVSGNTKGNAKATPIKGYAGKAMDDTSLLFEIPFGSTVAAGDARDTWFGFRKEKSQSDALGISAGKQLRFSYQFANRDLKGDKGTLLKLYDSAGNRMDLGNPIQFKGNGKIALINASGALQDTLGYSLFAWHKIDFIIDLTDLKASSDTNSKYKISYYIDGVFIQDGYFTCAGPIAGLSDFRFSYWTAGTNQATDYSAFALDDLKISCYDSGDTSYLSEITPGRLGITETDFTGLNTQTAYLEVGDKSGTVFEPLQGSFGRAADNTVLNLNTDATATGSQKEPFILIPVEQGYIGASNQGTKMVFQQGDKTVIGVDFAIPDKDQFNQIWVMPVWTASEVPAKTEVRLLKRTDGGVDLRMRDENKGAPANDVTQKIANFIPESGKWYHMDLVYTTGSASDKNLLDVYLEGSKINDQSYEITLASGGTTKPCDTLNHVRAGHLTVSSSTARVAKTYFDDIRIALPGAGYVPAAKITFSDEILNTYCRYNTMTPLPETYTAGRIKELVSNSSAFRSMTMVSANGTEIADDGAVEGNYLKAVDLFGRESFIKFQASSVLAAFDFDDLETGSVESNVYSGGVKKGGGASASVKAGFGGRDGDDHSFVEAVTKAANGRVDIDPTPGNGGDVLYADQIITLEMSMYYEDLHSDKNCTIKAWYQSGWKDYIPFKIESFTGAIRTGGPGAEYIVGYAKPGQWYHFAVTLYPNSGKYDLYINGDKILKTKTKDGWIESELVFKENDTEITGNGIRSAIVFTTPYYAEEPIETAMDNFKIYTGGHKNADQIMVSVKDFDMEPYKNQIYINDDIPCLDMLTAVTTNVSKKIYHQDGSEVDAVTGFLTGGETLVLRNGDKGYLFKYFDIVKPLQIDGFEIIQNGTEAKVEPTIGYNLPGSISAVVILAAYQGDCLLDVSVTDTRSINSGGEEAFSASLENLPADVKLKAMIFDSLANMRPLTDVIGN